MPPPPVDSRVRLLGRVCIGLFTRATVTDHDRHAAFRATQAVLGVVPALLVLFFVAGERVDWEILVVGLAWRGWLLIYTLPYLVAAVTHRAA